MAGEDEQPLLNDWRQGDLALTPVELPIMTVDENGEPAVEFTTPVPVAIISQSCDIVRSHEHRPYVTVAALTPATKDELERARAGQNVRYGFIDALERLGLVVDFDLTATIDKEAVASWERTSGCASDIERTTFARSIARHRERFAFPDDFNDLIKPVRRWLESKRSAQSAYGRFVREIHEIKVYCDDWDNPASLIFFVIVKNDPDDNDASEWEKAADTLKAKAKHASYPVADFRVLKLSDMSAEEYVSAMRLDLDGLSDA